MSKKEDYEFSEELRRFENGLDVLLGKVVLPQEKFIECKHLPDGHKYDDVESHIITLRCSRPGCGQFYTYNKLTNEYN